MNFAVEAGIRIDLGGLTSLPGVRATTPRAGRVVRDPKVLLAPGPKLSVFGTVVLQIPLGSLPNENRPHTVTPLFEYRTLPSRVTT
jgi:hypothetical protein